MTWSNRLRLLGGLLTMVVVVAAATFHLNDTQARVESSTAQVAAQSYTIGTPYAGLVVQQLVEIGSTVSDGDPLFLIDSANLQRDLAQGVVPPRTVEQDIDPEGYLIVRATGDGTVTALEGEFGTFVRESTEMATVQRADSTYVQAEYTLTPHQYARIGESPQATVILPDGREIIGDVADITVVDLDGESRVVVDVYCEEFRTAEADDRLVSTGAPVVARLHLDNDGVVTELASTVKGFVGNATDFVADLFQEVRA